MRGLFYEKHVLKKIRVINRKCQNKTKLKK